MSLNTNIITWASLVQPGSPAPRSPKRRPRRGSSISIAITHPSFLNIIDTPTTIHTTPSIKDFHHDLTTLGYTSLFVHLPTSPSGPKSAGPHPTRDFKAPLSPTSFANIPIPPLPVSPTHTKSKTLKRFPSLSALRTVTRRSRSQSLTATATTTVPAMPMPVSQPALTSKQKICYAFQLTSKPPTAKPIKKPKPAPTPLAISTHKKAKYPSHRAQPLPAPLANELALMQFADGGSIDSHAKRLMNAQARAAAGTHAHPASVGVGDVYRDGKGGIWWDQEEELEYAHLLAGEKPAVASPGPGPANPPNHSWVRFNYAYAGDGSDDTTAEGEEDGEGARRGSVSTLASSLDARHVVRPSDEDALAAFGSCVPPKALRGRRGCLHPASAASFQGQGLGRKPEFLLAFVPRDSSVAHSNTISSSYQTETKTSRRRPAPLNLKLPASTTRRATKRAEWMDPEAVRRDFIESSFVPAYSRAPAVCPEGEGRTTKVSAGDAGNLKGGVKGRMRGMTLGGLFRKRE